MRVVNRRVLADRAPPRPSVCKRAIWSALVLLAPHYGDKDDDGTRWATWLQRLRRFRLRGIAARLEDLEVMRVAKGYERLEYSRRMRAYESGEARWRGVPERRWSTGLDWGVLGELFGWLTDGKGTGEWSKDSLLAGRLWEQEGERQKARDASSNGVAAAATLVIAATGDAGLDDYARPIAFTGSWVGSLNLDANAISVGGPAVGAKPPPPR